MSKSTFLVAELPFAEEMGGHCTLVSQDAPVESVYITKNLSIARDDVETVGESFLAVSRDSVQGKSGRDVREVLAVMNVDTSRLTREEATTLLKCLRGYLNRFPELEEELQNNPARPARTVVFSPRLRDWASALGFPFEHARSELTTPLQRNKTKVTHRLGTHVAISFALTFMLILGACYYWPNDEPEGIPTGPEGSVTQNRSIPVKKKVLSPPSLVTSKLDNSEARMAELMQLISNHKDNFPDGDVKSKYESLADTIVKDKTFSSSKMKRIYEALADLRSNWAEKRVASLQREVDQTIASKTFENVTFDNLRGDLGVVEQTAAKDLAFLLSVKDSDDDYGKKVIKEAQVSCLKQHYTAVCERLQKGCDDYRYFAGVTRLFQKNDLDVSQVEELFLGKNEKLKDTVLAVVSFQNPSTQRITLRFRFSRKTKSVTLDISGKRKPKISLTSVAAKPSEASKFVKDGEQAYEITNVLTVPTLACLNLVTSKISIPATQEILRASKRVPQSITLEYKTEELCLFSDVFYGLRPITPNHALDDVADPFFNAVVNIEWDIKNGPIRGQLKRIFEWKTSKATAR